jgi:hypothetical protein
MENKHSKDLRSEYLQQFDRFNLSPIGDHEIEWIADRVIEWAEDEESVTLLGFCAANGISQSSLYDWEKRNHRMRQAISTAKSIVGARREKMALQNKFNAGIVNRTMGVYDDRVHAYDKEMRMLGSSGEDRAQTINVVMPPMPETDTVPKKRKKKES